MSPAPTTATTTTSTTTPRKRKADTQDNERLSKRLSLLNLERNGSKLYVPVEAPSTSAQHNAPAMMPSSTAAIPSPSDVGRAEDDDDDEDIMKLDNTKHKVYIYNIDDELSSEDDDATSDDGRLVFLPDIEKHLRANRIPPQILANADGELAGMQLILYSDPKSLSVPEEQDGVRKAIIEARQRLRDKNSGKEDKSPASPRTETASHVNAATSSGSCSWDANGYCSDSSDAMDMD